MTFDGMSALIGAVIASLVAIIFNWLTQRIELKRKKKMLNVDLVHKVEVLIEYSQTVEELLAALKIQLVKGGMRALNADFLQLRPAMAKRLQFPLH